MRTRRPPPQQAPTPSCDSWALAEHVLADPLVRTAYFYGPPGIGKTYGAYRLGRVAAGVYPVTLTPETPASELVGHYIPCGDGLSWRDGPFARALRAGGRLVINEITHASSDVLAVLYPVLESIETAQLMLATGETLTPGAGFHVVATDNEPPWSLPLALQDRFESTLHLDSPHPAALAAIDADLQDAALRTMQLGDERRVTMRRWFAICRMRTHHGLERACQIVLGGERGGQLFDAVQLALEHRGAEHGL